MTEKKERVKKRTDPYDGRMVYEADVDEVLEIEVEKDNYQSFVCVEGKACKSCDFNYLPISFCFNFPCLASDRQDGKPVHFKWVDNA